MTREVSVRFGAVTGTGAGLGSTGRLSLLVDRPEGVAGGTGLGFSGAELLAAAIGGCFWNDLHHVAAAAGLALVVGRLDVVVTLAGSPLRVVRAKVTAELSGAPDAALRAIFDEASGSSTIAASIAAAVPVTFERVKETR